MAQRFSWRVWHTPAPMRPIGGKKFVPEPRAAGLPDLVLMSEDPPRLVFAEVKATSGTLSEQQREFLRLARGVAEATSMHALGLETEQPGTTDGVPLGVYVWQPGMGGRDRGAPAV